MSQPWTISFIGYCTKVGATSVSVTENAVVLKNKELIVGILHYSKSVLSPPSLVELFTTGGSGKAYFVYENGYQSKDWLWFYAVQELNFG